MGYTGVACLLAAIALAAGVTLGAHSPAFLGLPDRGQEPIVTPLFQNPEFPSGCEAFSLAMCLRSMGYSVEPSELIDTYMPTDPTWGDYVDCYAGDARGLGSAMPPALVACTDAYANAMGESLHGVELTGCSFTELTEIVERGYPVLTWVTTDMEPPVFSDAGMRGYRLYRNFHCVLLYRVHGGVAYVADPLVGLREFDERSFRGLWEECGSLAMTVAES
ncbi:MAG: C39 family peptidase [Coriobacteriaceae bacterium]|nr:C39 family peptidase [Coriobacteriaceae bacterium]